MITLSSFTGGILFFIETINTYYADIFSVIGSSIIGFLLSGIFATIIVLIYKLLLKTRIKKIIHISKLLSLVLFILGIISYTISRQSNMVVKGLDPEFNEFTVYTANPTLFFMSWIFILLSISTFNQKIKITNNA